MDFTKISVIIMTNNQVAYRFESSLGAGLCFIPCLFVTGFGKTDHNVTIDISRNIDLKY